MNNGFVDKIRVSQSESGKTFNVPPTIIEAYRISSKYFNKKSNAKICLVLPSREYTSQWLTLLFALDSIKTDFQLYENEIFDSYKSFKVGQLLILNNEAIVKWVGYNDKFIMFSSKPERNASAPIRFAKHKDVIKLQPAPTNRTAISAYRKVIQALKTSVENPIDILLNIYTAGNKQFIKEGICLIDKFKDYDQIFSNTYLNGFLVDKYVKAAKISEEGAVEYFSPLLLTNNFERLIYSSGIYDSISKIVIDGYDPILESRSNYLDIESKKIPTLLITDLSEIDKFKEINNLGFEFFNFTKEKLKLEESSFSSPFYNFENKLKNYFSFKFNRVYCKSNLLTKISQLIHELPSDESNNELTLLRISFIKIVNIFSRICHRPSETEIYEFKQAVDGISEHFKKCHLWLGQAKKIIEEIIPLLNEFINQISYDDTDKCKKFEELLNQNYDFVICTTDSEANNLRPYIQDMKVKVISVGEVNDTLLSSKGMKAILTGWPRASNFNRLLVSFIFNEITALFYSFENTYYNSIQNRNVQHFAELKVLTDEDESLKFEDKQSHLSFSDLFQSDEVSSPTGKKIIDIYSFELTIENTQYSKYILKGNPSESIKAQRIDFGNETFIYATESHKFIVINELLYLSGSNPLLHNKKIENLKIGDIIAFINTDRDILVEMVRKSANADDYESVVKWINLWKELLDKKYAELDYDFRALVRIMRNYKCERHEATIRTWINDENMIGPEDDMDLRVIANMTNSELLRDNIGETRKAINIMTGWRMRAADNIRDKIKNKLLEIVNTTNIINSSVEIQDLGRVEFLKVIEIKNKSEDIDRRFIHRLISKEYI